MQTKPPQSKPLSKPTRHISPAEWAWLNQVNRQLAHDEYMQTKREFWLAARLPAKKGKIVGRQIHPNHDQEMVDP